VVKRLKRLPLGKDVRQKEGHNLAGNRAGLHKTLQSSKKVSKVPFVPEGIPFHEERGNQGRKRRTVNHEKNGGRKNIGKKKRLTSLQSEKKKPKNPNSKNLR